MVFSRQPLRLICPGGQSHAPFIATVPALGIRFRLLLQFGMQAVQAALELYGLCL
jgi:hypothetical protein